MAEFSRDVTAASFEQEVIGASASMPVVVDFWAEWCGPCRALKPILEKLAAEFQGEFVLAKVDTDREPEIAAQFGIRSIPNVKAFVGGKVLAEFSGALPESAVRSFLRKLLPSPGEKLRLSARQAIAQGDSDAAERDLREALRVETGLAGARIDLAELLWTLDRHAEADLELQALPGHERDERAAELLRRIEFWKKGQSLPPLAQLEAALLARPQDHEARLALAERCIADGSHEAALAQLIEVVRGDRGALRERARKTMLDVFAMAGGEGDLVPRYRRLLASALY